MMTIGLNTESSHGKKRKTSAQLQLLEKLYSEEKYPTPSDLEDYATLLNLTYKETRTWFIEKRRKEKRENEVHDYRKSVLGGKNKFGFMNGGKGPIVNAGLVKSKPDILSSSKYNRNKESNQLKESVLCSSKGSYKSTYKHLPPKKKSKTSRISEIEMGFNNSTVCPDQCNEKLDMLRKTTLSKINHNCKKIFHPQVLVSKDYILKSVFRKDGPPLGEEFDSLPGTSSGFEKDSRVVHSSQDRPKTSRNRKRLCPTKNPRSCQPGNATTEKHGIGKGLMTIWRARNPDNVKCPSNIVFAGQIRPSPKKAPGKASKRAPQIKLVPKKQTVQKKFQQKRSPMVRRRKVPVNKESNKATSHWQKCNLLNEQLDTEQFDALAQLVDDEELELREIQRGPNPLRCSHFALDGKHGCPLCKDMLARFPPQTVKMKQLFCSKPWDTSPGLVKKLIKVLKLLYNDAATTELCPFTITELANAFTDKDSMLLGNIHVSLLKFLLLNVERDALTGYIPRASKDGRFLGFLNFVKEQEIDVNTWYQALNPLTWIEIHRQVLVAAGFGTKSSTARRDDFSKERHLMVKYGIHPRTLKGELFNILSEHGNSGAIVTELAKASQIVALDLADTTEVQKLIYSTLSSDITLFEKISSSAYRLRINPEIKGNEENQSDSEVDDDFGSCSGSNTNYDSDFVEELNSDKSNQKVVRYKHQHKRKNQKKMIEHTEIDESYSGEAWLLGLMEGEYSDLSIDEKLDALIALIDLTASCCSFRAEELEKQVPATAPTARFHGSGAKIKKSLMDHILMLQNPETVSELPNKKQSITTRNAMVTKKSESQTHSMQSIYLGSDRRYNDYWLFIGPCDITDPGHRQVYFESSEDGHWEIINSSQALDALLSALDSRGSREARLLASLEKKAEFLSQAMDNYMTAENNNITSDLDNISGDGSSPISDVDNNLDPVEPSENQIASSSSIAREVGRNRRKIWDRMQEFDKWVWDAFYSNLNAVKSYKSKRSYMESLARCESCHDLYCRDERHCRTCHTTFQLDFDIEEKYAIHVATCTAAEDCSDVPKHKVLSSQLQALKAASHAIEAVMPETSLSAVWTRSAHKLWAKRLQRTSSLPEFLQVLTDFVGAINDSWLYECAKASSSKTASDDLIVNFQTMPQTTSAVALWIVKLDALITPQLEKAQPRQEAVVPYVEKAQPMQEAENARRSKRKRSCTS